MAPKIEKMKKADAKPEEGTMFLSSTGVWFKAPKLDYDKILKYEENIYLAGALEKQHRLIFREKYTINVTSPDGTEADESDKRVCADLAKTLTKMAAQPDVNLWASMQKLWRDQMIWGPWIANDVWDYEKVPVMMGGKWNAATNAVYWMKKVRRLPPESFISTGLASSKVRNRLLPGICLNDTTGEIEYYQRQDNGSIKKLQYVTMITDPISSDLGGKPIITPVYYVLPMLDFTWQGLMQQNNIIGAGGKFFIKVTNPVGDDKAFAQEILNNINRSKSYQLRGNMDVVSVPITATSTPLDTINALDKLIRNHFSPASSLAAGDATNTIGGSSGSELELYRDYLKSQHQNLEDAGNFLLQPFLDKNNYEGYTVNVDIPEPSIDYSDLFLKTVNMGYATKTIGLNDRRLLLASIAQKANVELNPLDNAGISALTAEFEALAPAAGNALMAKAQLAVSAATADRLDPEAYLSKRHIRNTVQSALGIEDGEE